MIIGFELSFKTSEKVNFTFISFFILLSDGFVKNNLIRVSSDLSSPIVTWCSFALWMPLLFDVSNSTTFNLGVFEGCLFELLVGFLRMDGGTWAIFFLDDLLLDFCWLWCWWLETNSFCWIRFVFSCWLEIELVLSLSFWCFLWLCLDLSRSDLTLSVSVWFLWWLCLNLMISSSFGCFW